MNTSNSKKSLCIAIVMTLVAGFSVSVMAGEWQANHPRRAQVNSRLLNQNRRINQEVREGEMSPGQAAAIHHFLYRNSVLFDPVDDAQCAERRRFDERAINLGWCRVERLAKQQA